MTSGGEYSTTIPYERVSDEAWPIPSIEIEWIGAGELAFRGDCPRCAHPTLTRYRPDPDTQKFTFTFQCACAFDHLGQPGNAIGCGAFWAQRIDIGSLGLEPVGHGTGGGQSDPPSAKEGRPAENVPEGSLAGYSSDIPSGVDLLGFEASVTLLSSVLTARTTQPPLAIGLFGGWGAGKSFFMTMMRRRIEMLADASSKVEPHETAFCSEVRQVVFNAWLYSDRDPWPTLARLVSESIAGIGSEAEATQKSSRLRDFQEQVGPEYEKLTQQRESLEQTRAALEERVKEIDANIVDRKANAREKAKAVGPAAQGVVDAVETASEVNTAVRRFWKSLDLISRPAKLAIVVAIVIVLSCAFFFALHPSWLRAGAAFLVWFSATVAIIRPVVKKVTDLLNAQSGVLELQNERRIASEEIEEHKTKLARLDVELRQMVGIPLLPAHAERLAAEWARREQEGLSTLSLARETFRNLSDQISASYVNNRSTAHQMANGPQQSGPLIDRIIVYIDDLDRCQPRLVVQTLEAIKLLLDIPNFVVVVGVDPRWLARSLEIRFASLLEQGVQDQDGSMLSASDYLEKIFQYAFILPRMNREGFSRLVTHLLPVELKSAPLLDDSLDQPSVSSTGAVEAPTHQAERIELAPSGMVVQSEEVEYIRMMAPLIPTPRSAKRLINIYQLLRTSLPPDRIRTLVDGNSEAPGYRYVVLLLAIAVGFPSVSPKLFRVLAGEEISTRELKIEKWWDLVDGLMPKRNAGGPFTNILSPTLNAQEAGHWAQLVNCLQASRTSFALNNDIEPFRIWLPVVARFTFQPFEMVSTGSEPT